MKWRFYRLYLIPVMFIMIGINASPEAAYTAGSAIPRFENSHGRSVRNHRNRLTCTQDSTPKKDFDCAPGMAGELPGFVPVPYLSHVTLYNGESLPDFPAPAPKRFLRLRSILI